MNAPKWTPGPWRFTSGKLPRVISPPITICGVHRIGRFTSDAATPQTEANGHLIAAAPTMALYVKKRAEAGDAEAAEIWESITRGETP